MTTYDISSYSTLSTIVKNVSAMVGFPKPSDPAGSPDPAVQQMVAAVNMAGSDMLNLYDWQNLAKRYEIQVAADFKDQKEKSFDLPPDFWCFIDQTQWNKDTRLPAIGPISPQAWQQIIIRTSQVVLTFLWQIRDGKLWVLSPPAQPQTFSFFYMSRGWVQDAENANLMKNEATKNGDTILFDEYLMTLLARVKWLQMKGMDFATAMADFKQNYEFRKGKTKGAPILSMVQNVGLPYINMLTNVPDTGYGSLGQ